jgi:glucosamine 6-phosphate synthetase-like amidotransferase/phosphosugar isomerase protein
MCGIVGYIGEKEAYPILIGGLKKLEYRGYDSSGIMLSGKKTFIKKTKGKVSDLERLYIDEKDKKGNVGLGHTRWYKKKKKEVEWTSKQAHRHEKEAHNFRTSKEQFQKN